MLTKTNIGNSINGPLSTLGAASLFTAGKVTYVSSLIGSNDNLGTDPNFPKASIAGAQTASTASKGDIVVLLPGHAETFTAALALSKAGVSYIGLGSGSLKPTITVNAAVDGLSITGANVVVANVHFAPPETDAATAMINVAAAGVKLYGITGIGSKTAKNFVDCITIAAGADDLEIDGLEIYNTTVAVNSFISIEAAVARFKLFNVFCFGDCVTAGIIDAATATQIHFKNVSIGTVGTTIPAAILDSNPTGFIEDCRFAGTSTTLANNAALGTGVRLFNVLVLEETDGSAQGALIPAVDAN